MISLAYDAGRRVSWLLHLEMLEIAMLEDGRLHLRLRRDRVVHGAREASHDAIHLADPPEQVLGVSRLPVARLVADLDRDSKPSRFLEQLDEREMAAEE